MKNLSLLYKTFIWLVILIFPFFITFLITYRLSKENLQKEALVNLEVIADAYEGEVYQFLEMTKRRALDFSSDGFIRDSLPMIARGDTSRTKELSAHIVKNKMSLDKSIHETYVFTLDGRIAASPDPSEIGMDLSGTDFFLSGGKGISLIEKTQGHERVPEFAVSAPIFEKGGRRLIGVLTNFVLIEEINKVLSGEFIKELGAVSWDKGKRRTLQVYIVNKDKVMITKPFDSHMPAGTVVASPLVDACLQSNRETSQFGRDYRGVRVAETSMCIPSMKWTLLTTMDESEALATVAVLRKGAMITGGIVAGLIGILLMFYYKGIIKPLRLISAATKSIAAGSYGITIPVKTGDEIGTLSGAFNHMSLELENRIKELSRLSTAIEQSINITFITDRSGKIEYVNPAFEQVTGYAKDEAIGQNPRILASGETTKAQYKELWNTITSGQSCTYIFKNKKKNGQYYWASALISPIKNEKGEIINFLAIQEDITEKKKSEEKIQYLVCYDELTGFYNRTKFMELMNEWITFAGMGSLFLIDIDDFKTINEAYGYGVGDGFLHAIAGLLDDVLKGVKKKGILGHLGGDEFSIFIPDTVEGYAVEIAEEMRRRIEEFHLLGLPFTTTASIGIVFYPAHGKTTKELFTLADSAIDYAKGTGKNKCHIYRAADKGIEKIFSRVMEKERLIEALQEDRFEPWFQPILNLKDNKVSHYEALARMRSRDGGIILPAGFIETAERFGLIGKVDRFIIKKTMAIEAMLRKKGISFTFSMNLSGRVLGDEAFLSFIKSAIDETGADPNNLIFEITETVLVHDMHSAIKFIEMLKSISCHFSLDDFGVGFTSFIYLREMGVDYVKIDGAFVKNLHKDFHDQLFVKAISGVARGMGIKTVAEFVESEETIRLLKEFDVDYAQGYAIGKPAPWEEIERKYAPDS